MSQNPNVVWKKKTRCIKGTSGLRDPTGLDEQAKGHVLCAGMMECVGLAAVTGDG